MEDEKDSFDKALEVLNYGLGGIGLKHFIYENSGGLTFWEKFRKRWILVVQIVWYNLDGVGEVAWFLAGAMSGKSLLELTYVAPCAGECILTNVKTYYLLKHEPQVQDLLVTLRRIHVHVGKRNRPGIIEELENDILFFRRTVKYSFWLNIIVLGGFALMPFLNMALAYNATGEVDFVLPFLVLYPFDPFTAKIWPFLYLKQVYSSYLVVFLIFESDCFYYFCCTHLQKYFKILHYDLLRIINENTIEKGAPNETFWIEFKNIIAVHRELFRCVGLMEQIYSKSTLYNAMSSSLMMCLTGFNITAMEYWPLLMPFIAFLVMVSIQIFIFCYYGDIIMLTSSQICSAVYNSKWYIANVEVTRNLFIVLHRAQKSCRLTAYGFSDVNLKTFSKVVKTAWSYFALLSSVNRNK